MAHNSNYGSATVRFPEEPALWPETYTDCFAFDLNAALGDINECVRAAFLQSGESPHTMQGRCLFTDSQAMVDCLKDEAYGYEIAFRHTHIPERNG
jgi:hypothetical protein